eukprot:CAMPEP_0198320400 /NCGR_PEP_ID=MMETSP1450-20131203/9345_1 /TAXON_ID=753684 ORGANISM="Madagascaria erythrocladiodes, Strain CCMP3234" /NCGR_SAMPLE_ID=MMETSP1450 /ASSEMBLY_ACC=CAM_ASM_001115 /LENGTH=91 /DNA_ID=CAMNT_0044023863 /DNA_START=408 /DNA_END=684 /DNA_ORIENTATION=+
MGGWILTVRVRVEQQEYLPLWHVVSTLHFPALQHKRDPDPAELKVGAASPHPLSYRALTTAGRAMELWKHQVTPLNLGEERRQELVAVKVN